LITSIGDDIWPIILYQFTERELTSFKCVSKWFNTLGSSKLLLQGRNNWFLIEKAEVDKGIFVLSDNRTHSVGAAICKADIIVTKNTKLRFTFQLYTGQSEWIGDGICFFLVNAALNPRKRKIGPSGAGMGYTNLRSFQGMPHGVLGIGFDEWGNFTSDYYKKTGPKCYDGRHAWSVCLRGPGNGSEGYDYIKHIQLPPWSNMWTLVDIVIRIDNQIPYLSLTMTNETINTKVVFQDLQLPHKLPEKIALGLSATTGMATSIHKVKDFTIYEQFGEGILSTTVGTNSAFHSIIKPSYSQI